MRRWGLWVLLLLSVGLNLGFLGAWVFRGDWRPSRERPDSLGIRPGRLLADRLELEGPSRDRFLASHEQLASAVRRNRRELFELRRRLRQTLAAPELDRQAMEALVGEIAERQRRLEESFVDHVLEIRGQLDGPALERYLRWISRLPAPGERRPPRAAGPWVRPGWDRAPDDSEPQPSR